MVQRVMLSWPLKEQELESQGEEGELLPVVGLAVLESELLAQLFAY